MILGAHKLALTVASLVCLVIIIVAAISSVWPKQEELFFELGLLGKDRTADLYFANEKSIVDVGDLNSWFVYIHNHMGTVQDVSVRVKLLNSTMKLPDEKNHQSSIVQSFTELSFSLSVNETILVPFYWSIIEAESQNNSTVIKRLMVNEQSVDVVVSDSNSSFRVIFELWVRDNVSGEYMFEWKSKEGFSSASLNIGFKLDIISTNLK